jgi:hypothetical protein
VIGGAQRPKPAAPDSGTHASPAFPRRLRQAATRFVSPLGYLALFGGVQLGLLLWLGRFWPGWLMVASALALATEVVLVAAVRNHWTLKLVCLGGLIALLVVVPTLILMYDRSVRGITSVEHDGAIQAEVAMDRFLHGQPIYGVDWSKTAVAQVPWPSSLGPHNPALGHNVYFPLVALTGIPVAWVVRAAGLPYDYRQVLLVFLAIGLAAVWMLPIPPARRFAISCALLLGPLLGLYVWAGRSDVPVVALVILGLGLLARDRPALASLVIGGAVAYKLFAAPAVPFLLATLWLRWRGTRNTAELVRSLLALSIVPLITLVPFIVIGPAAFWRDVVLYPASGGPESYPIAGFGLGGFLLAVRALHPADRFPFWIFQLVALAVALRLTVPWFMRRPSLGRWLTGFVAALFAMTFFARYFNDSHLALVMALFACCVPLGDSVLTTRAAVAIRARSAWLDIGAWR